MAMKNPHFDCAHVYEAKMSYVNSHSKYMYASAEVPTFPILEGRIPINGLMPLSHRHILRP